MSAYEITYSGPTIIHLPANVSCGCTIKIKAGNRGVIITQNGAIKKPERSEELNKSLTALAMVMMGFKE